jgi:hypothetical protein
VSARRLVSTRRVAPQLLDLQPDVGLGHV